MFVVAVVYLFGPHAFNSGPVFNLIGASAVVAILVGVRRNRPTVRGPWVLFAVGQGLFVAGDVLAYNYVRFFHRPLPFPSVADVLYLAVYPALVAGLLILIRHRSPGRDRAGLIDSLIISIGLALVSWVVLMAPYAGDHSLSIMRKLISIAYPLMDVLVLAVAARLAVGSGKREPSFWLLMAAIVSLLATDSGYGLILLHGNYQPGSLLDGGWILFYLLLGAASLHPSSRGLEERNVAGDPKLRRGRLLVLAAASLTAPAVDIAEGLRGAHGDTLLVGAVSAVLFILVIVRIRELMVDISEHRRIERQLRETEQKYRSLVERLPAVVYVAELGQEGAWRYISPQIEDMLGFRPEEWIQRPDAWRDLLHQADRGRVAQEILATLHSGRPLRTEYRIHHRDGQVLWIRDEAEVLPGGGPPVVQGVMYDVSELKKTEDVLRQGLEREKQATHRLRAIDSMKNSFLEAVSHDLRTPLTTILGVSLMLDRDDTHLSTEDTRDLIGRVARNARKLDRLLTDLLDVQRLARGTVGPNREQVDVYQLAETVIAETELGDHPVTVTGSGVEGDVDRPKVERILDNLLGNAARYSPAGAEIAVDVRRVEQGLLLTVADRGPGVPPEMKEVIFEAFRQGPGVIRHSPGVGIGLSLVARFADLHGGRAWVEDRPGGGSAFKVLLPDQGSDRPRETTEALAVG
ncbi:MAG TPA: ATP-binding protein [Actinomycetota bacterium]